MHSADEKMTLFVDSSDPNIKPLVSRHHKNHICMMFLELVQVAQAEGEAVRIRRKTRWAPLPRVAQQFLSFRRESAARTSSSNSITTPQACDAHKPPPGTHARNVDDGQTVPSIPSRERQLSQNERR